MNDHTALAGWHAATPELVAYLGKPGFAERLTAALRAVAPFDLSCIFAYPGRDRPHLLHDGLGEVSSRQIMRNYLDGTYLLDAVYSACLRRAHGAVGNGLDIHLCPLKAPGLDLLDTAAQIEAEAVRSCALSDVNAYGQCNWLCASTRSPLCTCQLRERCSRTSVPARSTIRIPSR